MAAVKRKSFKQRDITDFLTCLTLSMFSILKLFNKKVSWAFKLEA